MKPLVALPPVGTWRSFTDEELERMGLPYATVKGFMRGVLVHLTGDEEAEHGA